jgi:hypothetical protein
MREEKEKVTERGMKNFNRGRGSLTRLRCIRSRREMQQIRGIGSRAGG